MICPHCGKENPQTARFCAYCGHVPQAVRPTARPGRRRLWLVLAALALVLVGGVLAFAGIRNRRAVARGVNADGMLQPSAGVVTPGYAPGSPSTLAPSDVTGAQGGQVTPGQPVAAHPSNATAAPSVTSSAPGNLPEAGRVTAGQPGETGASGPVTATPPDRLPGGSPLTATGPNQVSPGSAVTAAPPGDVSGSPVTSTPPGNVPVGPPMTTTPPGESAPRGPSQQEIDLVREYLRRLAVIQARDNRLNEAIGEVAGGSMLPWAQSLGDLEDDGGFFAQYERLMRSYARVAAAKESLANEFQAWCEPIARACPPVQTLHRWYVRYFQEWVQATRTLERALRQHDLGLVMQLQGLVRRAENTERQAEREEQRLRDRYGIPPDPAGPR